MQLFLFYKSFATSATTSSWYAAQATGPIDLSKGHPALPYARYSVTPLINRLRPVLICVEESAVLHGRLLVFYNVLCHQGYRFLAFASPATKDESKGSTKARLHFPVAHEDA